jgi:hypothetical protein
MLWFIETEEFWVVTDLGWPSSNWVRLSEIETTFYSLVMTTVVADIIGFLFEDTLVNAVLLKLIFWIDYVDHTLYVYSWTGIA